MSPDCEHCNEHGENTANIEWTKAKQVKMCEDHTADLLRIGGQMDKRVKTSNFYWVVGGISGLVLALLLSMFGLYERVDAVGRNMSTAVTETTESLGKQLTETRIGTINKLSDIRVEQHKISTRVEDFGQRLEGLAQNQKILMRQVTKRFGDER